MSDMINFGIDLGTTNSLVAKFNKGTVEVFKNPNGFKETLPSVVGFRNDRILVGDQAKAYLEKDSKNVVAQFKRKMGTTEAYRIKSLGQSKTPIELSAFVLKELKNFIHTQEMPESMVITIPASFDMVQSNATKEAGYMAGFKQVVLLQEPIAASLAYANKEKRIDLKNSQWIVYDFGGGTFDVALVRIVEEELKVLDHEGYNYLGGADFDALIVKKIITPQIEKKGQFTDLLAQMTSESGRYNTLWYALLRLAEEAKIELSTRTSAEIDLSRIHNLVDETGKSFNDLIITVTRSEFEDIIKDAVYSTAEMLKKILTRNSLRPQDLKFVLMVGGSTYIPFVRKRIEELLGIPVNTGIDPTNAIAIGAVYFAATKEVHATLKDTDNKLPTSSLKIKVSYNRMSKEKEEMFSAKVEGNVTGLFYRIARDDGGYDSGLKVLSPRITEDLPLQEDVYNLFTFKVYDNKNNIFPTDFNLIQIAQGKYSVAGQMLPEDLSLAIDDLNTDDAKLRLIFAKNSVLPTKTKMTVEASKTIIHGSDDEIRIIVVEGPSENHFIANKAVGCLVISAKRLTKDIIRGTDIYLTFEVSESRDLTVTAFINPSGPNFHDVFTPMFRDVPVNTLLEEVQILKTKLENEKAGAVTNENYEVAVSLEKLVNPVKELHSKALLLTLTPDDLTDDRYILQDEMRRNAQELNKITAGKRIERLRKEYHSLKADTQQIVAQSGNDLENKQFNEVVAHEHTFLNSSNPQKIEDAINSLHRISFQILRRTPDFLIGWFEHLLTKRETFNDQLQAKNLIEGGKRHIASEDYEKLAEVNSRLHALLPQKETDTKEMRYFTGIC